MARNCCLIVWDYEEDLKLLAHEEKYFNSIHAQFVKRADVFKVHAKRVYKSLNVLWFSGKSMDDADSRKAKCLDTVARISMHWLYTDQRLCKEIEGLSMYSKNVHPAAFRLVLQRMMAKVSSLDARVNSQMIWDADCAAKIEGAFNEIIPRANRLLDGDWMFRYFFYFGKANDILLESEKQIDAFFLQTFGRKPEDFPIDTNVHRENTKPPHEVAFNHVAQIISNRFLDPHRVPPEALDLSVSKSTSVSADLSVAKTASVAAVSVVEGNNPPVGGTPNFVELPRLLKVSAADSPDNVALAIERVVAGCSQTKAPEYVDLTKSPPQATSTAGPHRERLILKEAIGRPPVVALALGQTATPIVKGLVKKSLITLFKPADPAAPQTESTAATPTSQGVADIPTEDDKATLTVSVQRPTVQRFLYVRSQKQNDEVSELAANKLRLGFGDEGAVNVKGALFERFYRPDVPAALQRKQFEALKTESATAVDSPGNEGAAAGSSCGSRSSGRCIGHVVHMNQPTDVAKATKAVESSVDENAAMPRKLLAVEKPAVAKPGKVVAAADKTSAYKFVGNLAARRRFVANGRQPFKEIRPALPKTGDVDAEKPGGAPRVPPPGGRITVSKMDYRFKPYKLELHGGNAELEKAAVTTDLQEAAPKKYDFRARIKDGREGSDGKTEEQGISSPNIKMRKDLFNKQQGPE